MKNTVKKIVKLLGISFLALLLVACSSGEQKSDDTKKVGISMPSKALERWEKDGSFMIEKLEELGYEATIHYAQDDVSVQVSQVEDMITEGVDLLVIAPADSDAFTDVLATAEREDIPVIAYDRLLMHADSVAYYTTFDLTEVGALQGQYIIDYLELDENDGPFNIELFGGQPNDNTAALYLEGSMSVLQPYIDEGKLVVQSGQTEYNQVATIDWSASEAQSRMDDIISSAYTEEKLDAVLAQNDAIALGVVASLEGVGYGSDNLPMPVITGQDAEASSVQSIVNGGQTMTVFKDTEKLAGVAVDIIEHIFKNTEDEIIIDDNETYDNGNKIVPAILLESIPVDKDNYKETVIETGYIDQSEIKD